MLMESTCQKKFTRLSRLSPPPLLQGWGWEAGGCQGRGAGQGGGGEEGGDQDGGGGHGEGAGDPGQAPTGPDQPT